MKKRFLISRIFIFALGIAFVITGILGNEYFYSMGTAMIAVGIVKSVQYYRIAKDEKKMKEYETKINDERNKFIAQKAYVAAFWVSIYAEWIAALVLNYLNHCSEAVILNCLVCVHLVIYWISYFIYGRKY